MPAMIMVALALGVFPNADEPQPRPSCDSYVGISTQPIAIDAVILQLDKIPKIKGEYETGAQFAARGAAAEPPGPLVVGAPIDLHFVRYDADAQMLNVSVYALDNRNVSYDDVLATAPPMPARLNTARLKHRCRH